MFYRQKFVTNSSSTSFVAFGIYIDVEEVIKLCKYLISKKRDRIISWASGFLKGKDLEEFIANPIDIIERDCMENELLDNFLAKDFDIYFSPGEFVYITIGFPEVLLDDKGVCSLEDPMILQKGYKKLSKLIKGAGLNKEIIYLEENWSG